MSKQPSKSEIDEDRDLDHHPEDLAALDVFCSEVEVDEISFDAWGDHHQSLDLFLYLRISKPEAGRSGEREIFFSRTLKVQQEGRLVISREKVSIIIRWSSQVSEGFEFLYPRLGDASEIQTGDLRVKIKICK